MLAKLFVLLAVPALASQSALSRSGDIIITHAEPVKGDAVLISLDAANSAFTKSLSDMKETDVAGLVSHVVGATPLTSTIPEQVEAFPSSSIFSKPKSNVLILVPSVGRMNLHELGMSNLELMESSRPSFGLDATFEPRHELTQLTTMLTGELPSTHGVVSGAWATRKSAMSAFEHPEARAVVPTLADSVSHTFPEAMVVSVSACSACAQATSVHNPTANTRVITVSPSSKQLQDTASKLKLDLNSLISSEGRLLGAHSSSLTISGDSLVFSHKGSDVSFDLNDQVDFNLIAEIATVEGLLAELRSEANSQTRDASPDLFSLTMSGLSGVVNQYGSVHPKTVAAAALVDAAIGKIVPAFEEVYGSQVVAQVVLMGSPTSVTSPLVKKAVADAIGEFAHSQVNFERSYPTVFVESSLSSAAVQSLCSRVHDSVSAHGLKAECISEMTRPVLLQQKSATNATATQTTVTLENIVNFQINLWVTVLVLVSLCAGFYPIMNIDVTQGAYSSLLYAKKYV